MELGRLRDVRSRTSSRFRRVGHPENGGRGDGRLQALLRMDPESASVVKVAAPCCCLWPSLMSTIRRGRRPPTPSGAFRAPEKSENMDLRGRKSRQNLFQRLPDERHAGGAGSNSACYLDAI